MKRHIEEVYAYVAVGLGAVLLIIAAVLLISKAGELSTDTLIIIALFWGMLTFDIGIKLIRKPKKPVGNKE